MAAHRLGIGWEPREVRGAPVQKTPRLGFYGAGMRSSSVRIIALFGLLLVIAMSAHWIGAGPDPVPAAHHASAR